MLRVPRDTARFTEAERLDRGIREKRDELNEAGRSLSRDTAWKPLEGFEITGPKDARFVVTTNEVRVEGTVPNGSAFVMRLPDTTAFTAIRLDILPRQSDPKRLPENGAVVGHIWLENEDPAKVAAAKLEAERMTLYPEPFDLERTIHEVTMLLQPRAREKGIDLMIDFDMFLPTRYVGDPGRLRQVLTNLIGNAVKFTERGHVLVRVVGLEDTPGRQQVHVTVEDTGIGIAPENLDHIFGEFNQEESQSNRKFEGTGLGLAISQRLIERMEGAVWVDSEVGKGSCFGFRLTLPVAEEVVQPRRPIPIKRALVVDDQFINRTILERQLVPCGIAVIFVALFFFAIN